MNWLSEDERVSRWVAAELEYSLKAALHALKFGGAVMPVGVIIKQTQRAVMPLPSGLELLAFIDLARKTAADIIVVTEFDDKALTFLAKTCHEEVSMRIPYERDGADIKLIGNAETNFKSTDQRFKEIFT